MAAAIVWKCASSENLSSNSSYINLLCQPNDLINLLQRYCIYKQLFKPCFRFWYRHTQMQLLSTSSWRLRWNLAGQIWHSSRRQWRRQRFFMGEGGGGGWASQTLGNFCNFSIMITQFYAYFGQNSCFKAIIHQLKAFKISLNVLNRINEVQVL